MNETSRASFLSLFNEWQLNRTVGLSVLTSIQNSLMLLRQSPSASSSDDKVLQKLHQEDRETQRAALDLQDAYILLQTCVKKAARLADEMKELASRAAGDHLASPEQEVERTPKLDDDRGSVAKGSDISQRSDLKILLMMSAASSAVHIESHQVMGQIACSINLETSPEDLFGYICMWRLIPFLDDSLSSELTSLLSLGSE